MDINKFKDRPIILYVLQILCVLITLNKIITTNFSQNHISVFSLASLLPILITFLWIFTSIGFLTLKSWGWGLFIGLIYFNVFILLNKLIFGQIDFSFGYLVPVLVGIIIIFLLNRKNVLAIYKIGNIKANQLSVEIINFAVLCIFLGLYLISEPIILNKLSSSSLVAKLYLLTIGLILVMSGIGVWNGKKVALFSIQPFLLFICLSSTYIMVKDVMSEQNYFSFLQVLFYISISWVMYIYWALFLKTKLKE